MRIFNHSKNQPVLIKVVERTLFKFEKDLSVITKSLLNFYFRKQLDESIEEVEKERGYTIATYEEWFRNARK